MPFQKIKLLELQVWDSRFDHASTRDALAGLTWEIPFYSVSLILGAKSAARRVLIRALAGLERIRRGQLVLETGPAGRQTAGSLSGLRIAFLPAPGEEIFAGTTVTEELTFGRGPELRQDKRLKELTVLFGRDFAKLGGRSVWNLSAGERRLLLLASQALSNPDLWLLDEPLALLDGPGSRRVGDFLRGEARRGAAVVAALAEAGRGLEWADRVVVLTEEGGKLFSGELGALSRAGSGMQPHWNPELRAAAGEARCRRVVPAG
jgi:ABC-type branched-subunit amino acid transport system ATPase component